jgi:hypothetical protein
MNVEARATGRSRPLGIERLLQFAQRKRVSFEGHFHLPQTRVHASVPTSRTGPFNKGRKRRLMLRAKETRRCGREWRLWGSSVSVWELVVSMSVTPVWAEAPVRAPPPAQEEPEPRLARAVEPQPAAVAPRREPALALRPAPAAPRRVQAQVPVRAQVPVPVRARAAPHRAAAEPRHRMAPQTELRRRPAMRRLARPAALHPPTTSGDGSSAGVRPIALPPERRRCAAFRRRPPILEGPSTRWRASTSIAGNSGARLTA